MSLDYQLTNPDYPTKEYKTQDQYPFKFESIVFHCFFTGTQNLKTDDAIEEFYNRYLIQHVNNNRGLTLKDPYLTLDDVKQFRGLSTNVAQISRFEFDKRERAKRK